MKKILLLILTLVFSVSMVNAEYYKVAYDKIDGATGLGDTAITGDLTVNQTDGDDVFNVDVSGTNTGTGAEGIVKINSTSDGTWQNLLMLSRFNNGGNQTASMVQRCTRGAIGSETVSVANDECAGLYHWAYDGGNYDYIARMVGDVVAVNQITIESNATVCETDSGALRVVTVALHGLSVNDRVRFAAGTGALCTGISAATDYWVTQVDTTTKFNLSATKGGSNIAYTDAGTAFTSYKYAVSGRIWFGTNGTDGVNKIAFMVDDSQNIHLGGSIDTLSYNAIGSKGAIIIEDVDVAPTSAPTGAIAVYSKGGNLTLRKADEAAVGGVIYSNATAVGNVGAGVDTLKSYTLPANTLATAGDSIRVQAWGTALGTAANQNRMVRCRFGTTVIAGSATGVTVTNAETWNWIIDFTIIMRSAGAQTTRSTLEWYDEGASENILSVKMGSVGVRTKDETTALDIDCQGSSANAADNDVVQDGMIIEYLPAQ